MCLFNPKQQTPLTLKNTKPNFYLLLPRKSLLTHLRLLFKEEIKRLLDFSPETPLQRRNQRSNQAFKTKTHLLHITSSTKGLLVSLSLCFYLLLPFSLFLSPLSSLAGNLSPMRLLMVLFEKTKTFMYFDFLFVAKKKKNVSVCRNCLNQNIHFRKFYLLLCHYQN